MLERLDDLGVELRAEAGALRYQAPAGLLAGALRDEVLAHKGELLTLVAERAEQGPPLSFAQERLWFLDRLGDHPKAYHVPLALGVRGPLAPAALEQALAEVARRHESLRTSFPSAAGRPRVQVAPAGPQPLGRIDLSGLPPARAEWRAARLRRAEAARPFDLATGPLLRGLLLVRSAHDHDLLVTLHHAVCDAWSLERLLAELFTLYECFAAGAPSSLPELVLQYGAFARRQRQRLRGATLTAELAWWRRRLEGASAELDLPVEAVRRGRWTRAGRRGFAIEPELAAPLAALGRSHRAFPFTVYLSAFAALLGRWCGQSEVVVGTPLAHRPHTELEPLIGLFTNTLALRIDLGPADTEPGGELNLDQLVARVRSVVLAAQAHQDLPFEKLVAELRPERNLGRNPFFQALFAYQSRPPGAPPAGGLTLEPLASQAPDAKLPLLVSLEEERDGGLRGFLEYDAGLISPRTAEGLVEGYRELLRALATDPGQRLSVPSLLSPERRRRQARWCDGGPPVPAPRRLPWAVLDQARRTPDALAVRADDAVLSYDALARRALALADALRHRGVGPDVAVAVLCDRGLELPLAVLGITLAGGACVPIDPAYPPARRALMLEDARVALVVGSRHRLAELDGMRPVVELEALLGTTVAVPRRVPPPPHPDQLLYVLFTSGSTGRPKGVAFPHRALANLVAWQAIAEPAPPGGRTLQFAPASFDVFFQELFTTWTVGGELVIVPDTVRRDPPALLRRLAETATSRIFLPFVALQQLAEAAFDATLDKTAPLALRQVITAGEQLKATPALRRLFVRLGPAAVLRNHYGPTETHVATRHELTGPPTAWPDLPPIGRPLTGLRAALVDRHLRPVGTGQQGEIVLGGGGLARGYLGRPGLTAERFVPADADAPGARGYRTGDLGRLNADGELEYLGRRDGQVKVRGVRVELGEVEAALAACPGVQQAAVTVRGEGAADRRLIGFVVPKDAAAPPSPATLRSELRQRLPEALVPADLRWLAALPLTPSGKVDRRALPLAEPLEPAARGLERRPIEEALAGIWEEVLGLGRVEVGDDFFALGGHSLLATQVVARVRQVFGVELELRELFETPTLRPLAALLEDRRSAGAEAWAPIMPSPEGPAATAPLSFAQERMWVLARLQPGGSSYNMPAALRLTGPLVVPALAQALAEVMRRHHALGTRFVASAEGPHAVRVGEPPPALALVDLRTAGGTRLVPALSAAESRRAFDLEGFPFLRASLLWNGDKEFQFLLTMHHIVSDGWSIGLLSREVAALYQAFTAGRPSPLPEPVLQYQDFARWQRAGLGAEAVARPAGELAYWRTQLSGAPPVIPLPLDRPRTVPRRLGVGLEPFALDRTTAESLRRLGRQTGATLFMTLFAGLAVLLHRFGAGDDLVIGSATANRRRPELEGLIGCFANLLALRVNLGGDPTFREILVRARQVAFDAYAHQDLPFERLVQELQPRRDLGQHPVVQVVLNLQNFSVPRLEIEGVGAEAQAVMANVADFDLLVSLSEVDGVVAGTVGYKRDVFERATVIRLRDAYATVLSHGAAEPDGRILDLPLAAPPTASAEAVGAEAVGDFHF